MPALVIMGRRWHAATDDFPLPAGIAAVCTTAWAAVVAAALGYLGGLKGCQPNGTQIYAYFCALLGVLVADAVTMGGLAWTSGRGECAPLPA